MDNSHKKHKERLRTRYRQDGLAGFHSYEVLELILSYSLIQKDTKQIAKKLIDEFGSLIGVINAPVEKLKEMEGIGERTVVLLKLFRDTMTYALRENITKDHCITSCHDVFNYLKHYYKGKQNEEFKVIYLNSRNYIITEETLFRGTVNEAKIYVRTLVQNVIKNGATAIIITHNHPGGTLKASEEDILITEKIKKVLNYVDVKVLDHIIVGDNDYISLASERMI